MATRPLRSTGESPFLPVTYMEFSLTIEVGHALQFESLAFDSKRNGTDSPTAYTVFYSENGTNFFAVGSGSLSGTDYESIIADNGGTPIGDLTGTVYFQIVGRRSRDRSPGPRQRHR